jgi:hypothetical protein
MTNLHEIFENRDRCPLCVTALIIALFFVMVVFAYVWGQS